MIVPKLAVDRLLTDRLILIPFTLALCKNIVQHDFDALGPMGLKRGVSWPDEDVMETLPKIINTLSKVEGPTGFESWMIIKKGSFEIIGDLGFKGFNATAQSIDLGYGIIKEERRKGFAEEAVREMIAWAFSNEMVHKITAKCLLENSSSSNLLHKLCFTVMHHDHEMTYWSLSKKEYNK